MGPSDDNSPLNRKFSSFSFSDDVSGSGFSGNQPPEPPKKSPPGIPDIENLKYERYRGLKHSFQEAIAEEDFYAQMEYEARQDRAFDAARGFLPRRQQIRDALEEISNLEMQAVVAAGILEETYRGKLKDQTVDDMIVAALCYDAQNFDDIAEFVTPEVVGMVDEMRMMAEEENDARRLQMAQSLETDTKRVFLANAIADLDMVTYECDSGSADAAPPSKEEHDMLAEYIMATTYGVETPLIQRAVTSYNTVSQIAGIDTLLQQNGRGEVEVNPFANVKVANGEKIDEYIHDPANYAKKSPKKPGPKPSGKTPGAGK
ncbi:MAG: hypothetical protein GC185_10200 [Alphaproteobacteria bacterium]|nr:hypothetical protein [Alphaproteobacteria bacterium]